MSGAVEVGQKLVLKATSARWTGQGKQANTYQATVVDIRSKDGTIKVQYADGGFKRFTKGDFAASVVDRPSGPSADEAQRTCRTVSAGEHLFVKGTGRWEGKGYYRAEVMECRESDDTVKVRFLDGAMKRWPRSQLMALVEEHSDSSGDTGTVFESLTDAEIKRAFEHADVDGDGLITVPELRASMREVGQQCSPKMAKDMITTAAGKGVAGVDHAGFLKLVRDREGTCRALYDLLKDKGETELDLSKTGEKHISTHLTALLGNDFNVSQFVKLLEGMDRNSDGQVSFKEFQQALLFSSVLDGKRGVYGLAETSLSFTMFSDESHSIPPWQSLSAGFLSGAISRTCTHPMERASLVMRASTDGAGLPTVVKRMVADGGPTALWRGNGANICQVGPEMAINFMVYDTLKKQYVTDPSAPTASEKFLCGSGAGAAASVVAQPMNTVGARLAVAKVGMYSSIPDCLRKTFQEGGTKALYRGYSVNLPRIIISRGGEMTIFSTMAEKFVAEGEAISPIQGLLFGGSASAVMSTATYPLLLARTKMQTQGTAGLPVLYDNWVDSLKKTVQGDAKLNIPRGGFGALFAGLNGSLLKFIPATAVQFMCYSQILGQLQKSNPS